MDSLQPTQPKPEQPAQSPQPKIIFFGNGPLAEHALNTLKKECQVLFHAHDKADLDQAVQLKQKNPDAYGVLASFGVLIKERVLEVFEPEGILNIHPSLLPKYRGASPIESAIINGDTDFSVSVMKLVKAMDAGPIYLQKTLKNPPLDKSYLYQKLAESGATLLLSLLKDPAKFQNFTLQKDEDATYCSKFEKSDGFLDPNQDSAAEIYRKIIAFQGFPKAKYALKGKNCTILEAHIEKQGETALLPMPCRDGQILSIDRLQPDGKKPMDAKSFLNGLQGAKKPQEKSIKISRSIRHGF